MGKKAVSSFVRAQMVALHDVGFNQVQISKQLNISRCCVQNAINKYKHLGIYDDSKRSGRPKKLDGRDFRHLKRLVKGDARLSATKIASISMPVCQTCNNTNSSYLFERTGL